MSAPLLSAHGVTRTYPPTGPVKGRTAGGSRTTALHPTDVEVHAGEVLAVIGESGSGKSTLVRILLGLDRPDAGQVLFEGRPLQHGRAWSDLGTAARRARRAASQTERELRRATGVVLQDPYTSLDPRFTVGRSIAEPLVAQRVGGDHRALVAQALDRVGLDPWRATQHPHELSGGQRQRVAIARAVVHRPRLLVGDEPLSALDVTVRAQVLGLLRQLRTELGLGLVVVSHDIGLVQHLADRVVVMSRGRVVESGTAASVLSDPTHPYTRTLLGAVPVIPGGAP